MLEPCLHCVADLVQVQFSLFKIFHFQGEPHYVEVYPTATIPMLNPITVDCPVSVATACLELALLVHAHLLLTQLVCTCVRCSVLVKYDPRTSNVLMSDKIQGQACLLLRLEEALHILPQILNMTLAILPPALLYVQAIWSYSLLYSILLSQTSLADPLGL